MKWILLVPHFLCLIGLWIAMSVLIVGILAGGWGFSADGAWRITGGGVIALLAIVGAIVLAVAGSYPGRRPPGSAVYLGGAVPCGAPTEAVTRSG